ncbi:MAG: hypothetical protein HYV32_05680 [Candidatus Kerfeldbacteria bacterium]|nr:hypothetical protein [Candidatus Kerfeldbacteria bacterium]
MTREQLQQYFPDTYRFFAEAPDTHPFWKGVQHVHLDDARAGGTLLSDLEQVFSSLFLVDGHHVVKDHLQEVNTHDELMKLLTTLYVAYLYRNHGARLTQGKTGYDIELEIADQLLAMGIVHFHNFDAPHIQFAEAIEDELAHMETLQQGAEAAQTPNVDDDVEAFLQHLKHHATDFPEHDAASHQVLAAITPYASFEHEVALAKKIQQDPTTMRKYFPHLAGIVLIDPKAGNERATFVSFHGENPDLEMLLNK